MFDQAHIDNVRRRVEQCSISEPFDCLRQITVDVSNVCFEGCPFCPQAFGWKSRCGDFMDVNTAKRLVERVVESGFHNRIMICGKGEPMLNPDILQLVDIFSEGYETSIITNGMDVGHDVWSHVCERCVEVLVSCHEWDKLDEYKRRFEGFDNVVFRNHDKTNPSLIITNRGGFFGERKYVDSVCTYPFYHMDVEPNGTYRFCQQNWTKYPERPRTVFDTSIREFFLDCMEPLRRDMCVRGRQSCEYCSGCDCNGSVVGMNFVEYWRNNHEE